MSLFQCEYCGCVENTALSAQGFKMRIMQDCFDWTGIEDRKGMLLCSACGPSKYRDGKPTEFGAWHGKFERVYLPKGEFRINILGNLEHITTGSIDYRQYRIEPPAEQEGKGDE